MYHMPIIVTIILYAADNSQLMLYYMDPRQQVTVLCVTLTCVGIVVEWSSGGNGSWLLFGDGRFEASLPSFPDVTKLAATSTSLVDIIAT